jgi:hypothetical protein
VSKELPFIPFTPRGWVIEGTLFSLEWLCELLIKIWEEAFYEKFVVGLGGRFG